MTSRGRQYPSGPLEPPPGWPEAAAAFLADMLGGAPEPGPPYTHTLVLPDEGRHWDRFWPDDGD